MVLLKKTMLRVGHIGGFHITTKSLRRMASDFAELSEQRMVIPVYLGHHDEKIKPIPRRRFRAAAKADPSLVGHLYRFSLTPDEKAATVVISFCRKSGLRAAKSQRMGLSPTLANPQVSAGAEIVGQLVTMDLCENPRDVNQDPFTALEAAPKPKRKATRMSGVKMPDLSDQQLAVLKKLDSIRREFQSIDWWSGAIRMLWPGQANEILGTDTGEDQAVKETQPDFAALSLRDNNDPHIWGDTPGQAVSPEAAKEHVDAQAKRMGGMIRE